MGKGLPAVLFENDSCLVLNKPAGLAVQGGEGVGVSLDSILAESYTTRPLLVHRLDKDTSGVILVAKNREAAARYSALFAGRGKGDSAVHKFYLAVISGTPHPESGVIRSGLDIRGQTRTAETSYRLLPREADYSLLELELGTGRMHQIRRHLQQICCPILGDDKYGDFGLNKKLKKEAGLKHLLLHASRLIIRDEHIDVTAPLPEYFNGF
jgi:23S rRNA pseudouridine955/2504/2580 synthase